MIGLGVLQYGVDYPDKSGTSMPTTRMPENTCGDMYAQYVSRRNQQLSWIPRFCDAVRSLGYTPWIVEHYIPAGNGACEQWLYDGGFKELQTSKGTFVSPIDPGINSGWDVLNYAEKVLDSFSLDSSGYSSMGLSQSELDAGVPVMQAAYDRANIKYISAGITNSNTAASRAWASANAGAIAAKYGTDAATILRNVNLPQATTGSQAVVQSVISASSAPEASNAQVSNAPQASVLDKLISTFTGASGSETITPASSGLSSIPTWAWLVGGAEVLFFMSGRDK